MSQQPESSDAPSDRPVTAGWDPARAVLVVDDEAGIVDSLDGWNREDVTGTYDFDGERYVAVSGEDAAAAIRSIRWMRARGLFVTTTDYSAASSGALVSRARARACAVGARPFVSDVNLRRLPAPLRCVKAR